MLALLLMCLSALAQTCCLYLQNGEGFFSAEVEKIWAIELVGQLRVLLISFRWICRPHSLFEIWGELLFNVQRLKWTTKLEIFIF